MRDSSVGRFQRDPQARRATPPNIEPHLVSGYNLLMRRSLEEVQQIAHTLPEEQRILLANALLESVVSMRDGNEVSAVWNDEIKRRLDEIDSGSANMIPGEQVRAEIVARLSPQARARLRV